MGRGEASVISIVILTAVVLVLAAVYLAYSMGGLGKSAASGALSQVESFLVNVADDLEASMYIPGTVLSYPLPTSGYGSFNLIPAYCLVNISGLIYYQSGALVYGVPPRLISYPPSFIDVIRGGEANGLANPLNESLVVVNPSAPLISIVQLGYGNVDGVPYGTYLVLFPRILAIVSGQTAYIYIPLLNTVLTPYRTTLLINVTNIVSESLSPTSPISIVDSCGPFLSNTTLAGVTRVNVVVINATVTFR